jgi:hypothetical protein
VRSDSSLDIMVLLRHRSEGGMNNFVTDDASVIKERVAQGGFAGMGVLPQQLPCHTWSAHRMHLKSL